MADSATTLLPCLPGPARQGRIAWEPVSLSRFLEKSKIFMRLPRWVWFFMPMSGAKGFWLSIPDKLLLACTQGSLVRYSLSHLEPWTARCCRGVCVWRSLAQNVLAGLFVKADCQTVPLGPATSRRKHTPHVIFLAPLDEPAARTRRALMLW